MPIRDVLRDSGTTHFGVGTNDMGIFFLTMYPNYRKADRSPI